MSDPVVPDPAAATSPAPVASATPEAASETNKAVATIRELLSVSGSAHDGVVPLLTELANKDQQASVLVQKAALMLGLADKFKDTDRGTQLRTDAESFLAYAKELQTSEEAAQVLEKAQKFADSVADKYERHGKGLFEQSQKLWDDVVSSGEAKQFLGVGSDILADWRAYGGSSEGQALISSLGSEVSALVATKGTSLLDLVNEYSGDASVFLDNAARHRATLEAAAKDVSQILEEDAEIKDWLAQGKQFIQERHAAATGALASGDVEQRSEDTLAELSAKGQEALTKFKDSDMGRDLLKKGTEVLSELQGNADLRPDALVSHAKKLKDDPEARQELVTKVKDAALDFLLQYLPTVKLDALEEEDDKQIYYMGNIDLSGFKLLSKDVDVILTDNGLRITAKNIKCDMKGLEWRYKSKSFPYIGASGKADALAEGISLNIGFQVCALLSDSRDTWLLRYFYCFPWECCELLNCFTFYSSNLTFHRCIYLKLRLLSALRLTATSAALATRTRTRTRTRMRMRTTKTTKTLPPPPPSPPPAVRPRASPRRRPPPPRPRLRPTRRPSLPRPRPRPWTASLTPRPAPPCPRSPRRTRWTRSLSMTTCS